jgi:hypothetical protein
MKNPENEKLNINVRMLRRIEKAILAKPEKFDMRDYLRPVEMTHEQWSRYFLKPDVFELCKTTACIAGWADLLTNKQSHIFDVSSRAADILGLIPDQSMRLFYLSTQTSDEKHWPKEFERPYRRAIRAKKWADAAKIAVERIEHFIKTRGAE